MVYRAVDPAGLWLLVRRSASISSWSDQLVVDQLVVDQLVVDQLVVDQLVVDQLVVDQLVVAAPARAAAGSSSPIEMLLRLEATTAAMMMITARAAMPSRSAVLALLP